MHVVFNRITAEGFLSLGEVTLDLDSQGIVFVKGTNNSQGSSTSNGSGKSSVFEAIIYALTGTTLRGTTDVINRYYEKKYCEVTLDLTVDEDEYEIKRVRNHPTYGNNLKLKKNGKDISGDKLRKSESILAQELGVMTSSLLSSVIILGQGMPNKFTDLSPSARKVRLEELSQSSDFIDELKVRLVNHTNNYKEKKTDELVKEGRITAQIEMIDNSLKSKSQELQDLYDSDLDVDELEKLNQSYKTEVLEHERVLKDIDSNIDIISEKLNSMNRKNLEGSYESNQEKSKVMKLKEELSKLQSKTCPTCGQDIVSEDKVNELRKPIEDTIDQSVKRSEELDSKVTELLKLIERLDERKKSLIVDKNNEVDSISILNRKIVENELRIDASRTLVDKLEKSIEDGKVELTKRESELTDSRKLISKYDNKLGILDYLNRRSSREFRGYLLSGVIEYLNMKINNYSEYLFGTTNLAINLDDNKIFIDYEDRPYENLSGGERQRADLAMQFSLRDMLMYGHGFSSNLLVIDEGFDNLDASGTDALIELITSMNSIDTICVVSHNQLSIPSDRSINVIKGVDNVSRIENEI